LGLLKDVIGQQESTKKLREKKKSSKKFQAHPQLPVRKREAKDIFLR
jgi:hypothetical protein